jgi:hypothetical protein
MIQFIHVARVLREAITTPYRVLVTRATGAAVRGRIESELAASTCQAAVLDFSGIEMLDLSCADEVVVKLLRSGATPFVALTGLREELCESVHDVLAPQHLAVAVMAGEDGAPALLGSVSDDMRDAFARLRPEAPTAPAALAAELGWPAARAAAALEGLAALRVAHAADGGYTQLPPA